MNRIAEYADIVADVMAAVECARKGQSHGRLNQMMLSTIARDTAFMPPCPESVLPIGRRRFSADNPAPYSGNGMWGDFDTRREVKPGVYRQE